MSLSRDLTDQFKDRMQQNHDDMDINFSIMVLGTNFWPLNPPANDFIIPAEILPTFNRFQKYYQIKHSGRKLTWLWNYSKNELRTNYLNQKYILMTSSYQMAVLVQYNNNDTLSLDELVAATAISKDILTQVLSLLTKAKILINDETDQYDLNPGLCLPPWMARNFQLTLRAFEGFKSKKIRVNLNQPIKAEVKAETTDVLKTVDEDRKYVIQATIVRYAPTCVYSPEAVRLIPCPLRKNHESPQDHEKPASNPGSHVADLSTICSEDSGYQEGEFLSQKYQRGASSTCLAGNRYVAREGVH
jgi:cullin 1